MLTGFEILHFNSVNKSMITLAREGCVPVQEFEILDSFWAYYEYPDAMTPTIYPEHGFPSQPVPEHGRAASRNLYGRVEQQGCGDGYLKGRCVRAA